MTEKGLDRGRLHLFQSQAGGVQDHQSVRLDRLDIHRQKPGFVKIDVDGKNLEALAGAEELLDKM